MHDLGAIDLMAPAAAECLVLVGIHSYLGLHVIRRRVIFVDLALAQVAALGTAVGLLFGMAPDSWAAWIYSVLTTFIGAAVFTLTRIRHRKIPHEAFIGLVYAVAAAAIVLLVEMAPARGADSIGKVLTGAILYVQWESIAFAAIVYSLVAAVHVAFRKRFMLITTDPEGAARQGVNVRLWDFLFYLTFGVVISVSVRTAGVLLVFVFLIAPAIFASMITRSFRAQLLIGWAMGTVVTVLGLYASYALDVPSGPSVVGLYGLVLAAGMVVLHVLRAADRGAAVRRVLAGVGALAATGLVVAGLGEAMLGTPLAEGHHHHEGALAHHHDEGEPHVPEVHTPEDFAALLAEASPDEQAKHLAEHAADVDLLVGAARATDDESIQLAIATALAEAHPREAAGILLGILRQGTLPFVKSEALERFQELAGRQFAYDPGGDTGANAEALSEMERWVDSLGG